MKIQDILDYTETLAPLSSQESWDNAGLLTGDPVKEVSRALLSLDITKETVEEAAAKGSHLIISHHPVIFDLLRSVSFDSVVARLIEHHIAALCLHTNLDRAQRGVNTALAESLGLNRIVLYPEHFLAVGQLSQPLSDEAFARFVKLKLNAPDVRFTQTDREILTVAVSSGGGCEGIELYDDICRFDAFVTGEFKHHLYLYATERQICAVDAGHFCTEDVVIEPLRKLLSQRFPSVIFEKSEVTRCPYRAV